MPNAAAGAKSLVGAGRLVAYGAGGSLITIPDRHKLVCSYLDYFGGLAWVGRGAVYVQLGCHPQTSRGQPSAGQQRLVAVTAWLGGLLAADAGNGTHSLCANETFLFGYKVGDFGDATNWPTPGEIAHKSVQVRTQSRPGEQDKALADLPVLLRCWECWLSQAIWGPECQCRGSQE